MSLKMLFTAFLFSPIICSAQNAIFCAVPFSRNCSDVMEINVEIGGFDVKAIFDPGATSLSFGKHLYDQLIKASIISPVANRTHKSTLGNGQEMEVTILNIPEIIIGGIALRNVNAAIVMDDNAPTLIGQSVISRFTSYEINNEKSEIVLKKLPWHKQYILDSLKIIIIDTNLERVSAITTKFRLDSQFQIRKILVEFGSHDIGVGFSNIKKLLTLRYFNDETRPVAEDLKIFFTELYSTDDIQIENKSAYVSNTIPNYIELWVR